MWQLAGRKATIRLKRDREFADSPVEEAGFEPSVPPDAVRADYAGYIAWRGSFEK
jgi:hypothetical protein